MFFFHVTCEQSKKLLQLEDRPVSLNALNEFIIDKFELPHSPDKIIVQVEDREWRDWIDVSDVRDLGEKEKLKVEVKQGK